MRTKLDIHVFIIYIYFSIHFFSHVLQYHFCCSLPCLFLKIDFKQYTHYIKRIFYFWYMVNKIPFVFTLCLVTLHVIRLTIYIYCIHVHFCIYKLFLTSGYVPWHGATILPHHIACHFVSYSIIYTLWFYKITN